MNERTAAFEDEYRRLIAQVPLPDTIASAYELCDCMRESAEKATYRVRSRSDGRFYVLKIAVAGRENLASEYELLRALSHPAIPCAALHLEQDDRQYLVREYIEGTTLDESIAQDGPMPARRAVSIVLDLCGVLEYLHAQRPPGIHRDIKPQNVLLTGAGRCALLDFGIARRFDDAADRDTVCMGTRATAAPEQFGYMQTDVRSDVYSTGLLLLFLLTGSLDPKAIPGLPPRTLRRIIRRCTRFDPADRLPSIARLRRRLAGCRAIRRDGCNSPACARCCLRWAPVSSPRISARPRPSSRLRLRLPSRPHPRPRLDTSFPRRSSKRLFAANWVWTRIRRSCRRI
jgi:serine/threonine protein kinase